MATEIHDLQTSALCTLDGTPLRCATPDGSATYRVSYEVRPNDIDSFNRICVESPGQKTRDAFHGLPLCSEHDAAVAAAAPLFDPPGQVVAAHGWTSGAAFGGSAAGGHLSGVGVAPVHGLLVAGGAQGQARTIEVAGLGGLGGGAPHGGPGPGGPGQGGPGHGMPGYGGPGYGGPGHGRPDDGMPGYGGPGHGGSQPPRPETGWHETAGGGPADPGPAVPLPVPLPSSGLSLVAVLLSFALLASLRRRAA